MQAFRAWDEATTQAQLQACAGQHHRSRLTQRAVAAWQRYHLHRMLVFSMQRRARRLRYQLLLGKGLRGWHRCCLRKAELQSCLALAAERTDTLRKAYTLHAWAAQAWVFTSQHARSLQRAHALAAQQCARRALSNWHKQVLTPSVHWTLTLPSYFDSDISTYIGLCCILTHHLIFTISTKLSVCTPICTPRRCQERLLAGTRHACGAPPRAHC